VGIPVYLLLGGAFFEWKNHVGRMHADGLWVDMLFIFGFNMFILAAFLISGFRSGVLGGRIHLDGNGGLRAFGRRVPTDQIRALYVVPGPELRSGLQVVLPTSDFLVAKGQSEADLKWIRALILKHLGASIGSAETYNGDSVGRLR
jgi:hypothetical protein